MEDLPDVPDLYYEIDEDATELIVNLSKAVDPEGSKMVPVVTSLPQHGKLYQVGQDGARGEEITDFFR